MSRGPVMIRSRRVGSSTRCALMAWQTLGSTRAREEPEFHLGKSELGRVDGDAEVGAQGDLEATSESGAVNRSHHRFG